MLLAVVPCLLSLVLTPGIAAAACTSSQRADVAQARQVVAALRAAATPGAADAAAVLTRARRSCADVRFARAVAVATQRFGAPTLGRRVQLLGTSLVGVDEPGAGLVWRFDAVVVARRITRAGTPAAARAARIQLRAAGFGVVATTWSDDPTRMHWDAQRQSAVASLLARSGSALDRRLAGASARAFHARGRQQGIARLPLLDHLRIAARVSLAARRSGTRPAEAVARALAVRSYARVRGARVQGWSRIDGRWSSAAEHRTLVAQASALLGRIPHASTERALDLLRGALVAPPGVTFGALPSGDFYPWPRDGAFDTQSVAVELDKPGSVSLVVYAADERVVRTITTAVEPGPLVLAWDGASDDGTILDAGDYRYNIDAVDLLGNQVRVAGLEQFRIQRDAVAPVVRSASARHVVSGGERRLVASWDVDEPHSPVVRTQLQLQMGARAPIVQLHDSLRQATVRRRISLARGTWQATFIFVDGSGNRTSHSAGSVVVR